MAEDISVRVQRLIAALRAARLEIANGSKEAELLDQRLLQLDQAFKFVSTGNFSKMSAEMQKLVDLIEAGTQKTVKLNGQWINTAPLIRAANTEQAKALGITEGDKAFLAAGESIRAEQEARRIRRTQGSLKGIDIPNNAWETQEAADKKRIETLRLEAEAQERLNKLRAENVIIAGPTSPELMKEVEAVKAAEAAWEQLKNTRREAANEVNRANEDIRAGGGQEEAAKRFTGYDENLARKEEEEALRKAKLEKRELERQTSRQAQALRKESEEIATNTKRYQNLNQAMGDYRAAETKKAAAQVENGRFGPGTLYNVSTVGGSDIFRSQFKALDEQGVMHRLDIITDKYGKTLVDTQKRFRSFAGEVVRNTGEFLKWSIAVGLVYTPLQKLGELTTLMIDNEAKLADVTVILGNATKTTRELFDAAAKIAQQTGETLNGTLEAYSQAYKAAGGGASSAERFSTANQLLSDSLILSKLSALDQAEAIDTLSAALRQTGKDLDQGTELLDKWIAVSKIANVDVGSLATGFAIVGDAAEAAGVDTDKLNAILGVLAESGIAGTKELGNQAKAIISGFQSDAGQKSLNNIGVATKTATGEMRNFFDVLQDVQNLRQQGLISDTQLSKITLAWGGGTRRQSVVQTLIESTKLSGIETASAMAETGTAADAMGKKLDTVQTAITRLSNSFQELAQALGDEGGILDIFKTLLDISGGVVKGLSEVMEVMGRSGPMLLLILGATAFLNSKGPMFKASIANRIAGGVGDIVGAFGGSAGTPAGTTGVYTSEGFKQTTTGAANTVGARTSNWLLGSSNIGGRQFSRMGSIASVGLIAAGAIGSATEKDYGKMGAQIAGGFIGLAISGGNPIGAAIGMSIGETFVNFLEMSKPKFENLFTLKAEGAVPKTEEDIQTAQKEAIAELMKIVPGITGAFGLQAGTSPYDKMFYENELATNTTAFKEAVDIINNAYGTTKLEYKPGQVAKAGTLSQEDYALLTTTQAARNDPVLQAKLDKVIADLQAALGRTPEEVATAKTNEAVSKKALEDNALLLSLVGRNREDLRSDLVAGRTTNAGFQRQETRLGGANLTLARWQEAMGETAALPGDTLDDYEKLMNILREAPDETVTFMTTLATAVLDAKQKMDGLTKGTQEYQDAANAVGEAQLQLAAFFTQTNKEIAAQIPLLQEVSLEGRSSEDITKIMGKVSQLFKEKLTAYGFDAKTIEAKMNDLVEIGIGNGTKFETRLTPRDSVNLISLAESELEKAGGLTPKNTGFSTYKDVTQQQLKSLVEGPQYESMVKELRAMGYTLDEQYDIAITSEGALSSYTKDWKIVQYLLQQILETEKDQLEGFYNFPADMFPYIPVTPGLMNFMQNNGGGTNFQIPEERTFEDRFPEPGAGMGGVPDLAEIVDKTIVAATAQANNVSDKLDWQNKLKDKVEEIPLYEGSIMNQYRTPLPPENRILGESLGEIGTRPGNLSLDLAPLTAAIGAAMSNFTQTALKNLSTRLSLNINNRMILQVSGRVLADIVRPYLKDELVKYSNTGGSSVSVNVV